MICPACKTNNVTNPDTEFCVQCGSDIHLHRLLRVVREEMQMKNEAIRPEQETTKNKSSTLLAFQIIPSIVLLLCAVFGIFVGVRFLIFLEETESHRASISSKWSETGFEQLQQMNATIKQELDLILDQRRENLALQAKVQKLTSIISAPKRTLETIIPSIAQG